MHDRMGFGHTRNSHLHHNNRHLINIIKEYRKLTKSKLLTEHDVFINGAKAKQQAAQNNAMWAECIKASLSKAARE